MLLGLLVAVFACWFMLALVTAVGLGRAVRIADYRQAPTAVPVSILDRVDRPTIAAAPLATPTRLTVA